MNNCDTDISGDCPAKRLVRSNLKIGTERLVTLAPNRSRLCVVLECRDAWSDRGILNARRSDAMATAVWGGTMRAASDRVLVCAKSGVFWGVAATGCTRRRTRNIVCSSPLQPAPLLMY